MDALAQLLEEQYGLRQVRCQLIKGTVRATYRVFSTQGDYILSIYRHQERTAHEIAAELDVLNVLDHAGIAVATPQHTLNGQYIIPMDAPEGERIAVLFNFVEGEPFSRQPKPSAAKLLGRTLAQIHHAVDKMGSALRRGRINFDSMVTQPMSYFVDAAPERADDIALLQTIAHRLQPLFEQLPLQAPAYGLIHGDVIPSNILENADGRLTLIDFDFCGYSWRVNDVANFLAEIDYWDMGQAVAQAFMEGYDTIRPLSVEEKGWILPMQAARTIYALGIPAHYINTWGSVYFSDKIIKKQIESLKVIMTQLDG